MLAMVAAVCVNINAQDVRMVTLQHGEELQVFRGTGGLKSAVEAAQKGDLITLTPGTFDHAGTIDKVLTIQGAGYDKTTASFTINLPEGEEGLLIEGINFNERLYVAGYVKSMTFKRCRFRDYSSRTNNLSVSFDSNGSDILFQQCKINCLRQDNDISIMLTNSLINKLSCGSTTAVIADHCFVYEMGEWVVVRNSIVIRPHDNPDATPLYNSIYVVQTQCRKVDCWKVGWLNGPYWYDNPFGVPNNNSINTFDMWDHPRPLPEDAKAKYLGADGTEIGVYGGELGYTSIPSNPQIVESEVPHAVDENGMLHVRFKVEAQK